MHFASLFKFALNMMQQQQKNYGPDGKDIMDATTGRR
jgi:hypothetical protein